MGTGRARRRTSRARSGASCGAFAENDQLSTLEAATPPAAPPLNHSSAPELAAGECRTLRQSFEFGLPCSLSIKTTDRPAHLAYPCRWARAHSCARYGRGRPRAGRRQGGSDDLLRLVASGGILVLRPVRPEFRSQAGLDGDMSCINQHRNPRCRRGLAEAAAGFWGGGRICPNTN